MRGVVFAALAACAPAEPSPTIVLPLTASELERTPLVVHAQEWTGGAESLCFVHANGPHAVFLIQPPCIPSGMPRLSVQCSGALAGDDFTFELTATYRFHRPPPYRTMPDSCDLDQGPLKCAIDAPPPGNYVVTLGDLAVPMTIGTGQKGPCTDEDSW